MKSALRRAQEFCDRFGLRVPILLAPMAGACAPSLSIAVADAGGLGACGAVLMKPDEMLAWATEVRGKTNRRFQMNLWIPDPPPSRDPAHEQRVRQFLSNWGPPVPPEAGDTTPLDFAWQCETLLEAAPPFVSSVMGLYPAGFVKRLKQRGIVWIANVSTVAEARAAEKAGADIIAVQGMEAGGHRGCFNAADAERTLVGLFALLPATVDAVKLPVVATGGIADERGVAAALTLGASAAQLGTAFLVCPEAKIHPAWAKALTQAVPEDTMLTRAFSGRAGRSLATDYVRAAAAPDAPAPAPYPVQRGLTSALRAEATKAGDLQRMLPWSGQSAGLAKVEPAADVVRRLWQGAQELLA